MRKVDRKFKDSCWFFTELVRKGILSQATSLILEEIFFLTLKHPHSPSIVGSVQSVSFETLVILFLFRVYFNGVLRFRGKIIIVLPILPFIMYHFVCLLKMTPSSPVFQKTKPNSNKEVVSLNKCITPNKYV